MIIKPKIRGFICITSHPEGCAEHVREQIEFVRKRGPIEDGPKKVLIIGASTGYGLASRVVSAFGSKAATLGVFYERPGAADRPASAGWYNSAAFEREAHAAGLWARSVNGDAFSDEIKKETFDLIREELGKVDLVIYSLAAPRRTDPKTGKSYRSVIKPIGEAYTNKNLDTDKKVVEEVTIQPATEDEIEGTRKVMGGEDWELWMQGLDKAGLLAEGVTSIAYDYVGPEVTWPIYRHGTIGRAKDHLQATAERIDALLKLHRGMACLSVNKAVVTQSSSAIPIVPLYISLLFKVMKEKGLHEGCIEQIERLFRNTLYSGEAVPFDDEGRIRMDDWEMRQDVQDEVASLWHDVRTENVHETTDIDGYEKEFMKLFGFDMGNIDYDKDVDPDVPMPSQP